MRYCLRCGKQVRDPSCWSCHFAWLEGKRGKTGRTMVYTNNWINQKLEEVPEGCLAVFSWEVLNR